MLLVIVVADFVLFYIFFMLARYLQKCVSKFLFALFFQGNAFCLNFLHFFTKFYLCLIIFLICKFFIFCSFVIMAQQCCIESLAKLKLATTTTNCQAKKKCTGFVSVPVCIAASSLVRARAALSKQQQVSNSQHSFAQIRLFYCCPNFSFLC